jgi:MYXO-CTERM domain-containing protein
MITNVGSYSVYLTAADGTRYDFLHMRPVTVREGQTVRAGDVVGYVANEFGGTPTTMHLHFNIRRNVSGVGVVYAPTYMSLVRAYERLIGAASGPRFRAEYVEQTFPLASEPFELAPGEERMGYIALRNTGTETWQPGMTFLGTTEPRDAASAIAGPDWVSPRRAATVDRVVAPGETGRFVFTVRAPTVPGDYPQYFNLVQEGVAWFGDDGGPPDRWIQVRVTVVAPRTVDAAMPDASVPAVDAAVAIAVDAGRDDAAPAVGPRGGPISGGCGCRAGSGATHRPVLLALVALGVALASRRRREGAC